MKLFLKNVIFTLLVPGTAGVYIPLLLARAAPWRTGPIMYISLSLLVLAAGLYVWAVSSFAIRGRGTPLPLDAPGRLVIQGPYRYTRNPMYLALFSALLGWWLLFQTSGLLLYGGTAGLLVVLFVIRYEEPHLLRAFGEEYQEYRARVPRWIPRLPSSWPK